MQRKVWSSIAVLTLAAGLSFGAGPAQATLISGTVLSVEGFSGDCTVSANGTNGNFNNADGFDVNVFVSMTGSACVVDYAFDTFSTGEGPFGFSYRKELINQTDFSWHLIDIKLLSGVGNGEVYEELVYNDALNLTGEFFVALLSSDSIRFKAIGDDLMPGSLTINEFVLYSPVASGYFSVLHTVRVPEPSSLALFALALAGLGFMMRRRRVV